VAACLPWVKSVQALSVETYQAYLKYVKYCFNGKPEHRDEMIKAYEFVLGYKKADGEGKEKVRNEDDCSLDFNSTPIWQDYIDLLKTEPEEDAGTPTSLFQTIGHFSRPFSKTPSLLAPSIAQLNLIHLRDSV
jgi:hypothetical protein